MSQRLDFTVTRLRSLAARGCRAEDLLEHVVSCLGSELAPLTFIAALREAFGVPLVVLRDAAEGWAGLNRAGCDIPTDVVVGVLAPYIDQFLETIE